jgi:hypothetical protein
LGVAIYRATARIAIMRRIKEAPDPNGILNSSKIIAIYPARLNRHRLRRRLALKGGLDAPPPMLIFILWPKTSEVHLPYRRSQARPLGRDKSVPQDAGKKWRPSATSSNV